MLVLSRHIQDEVVFPDLGITVEVIRLKGNTVRLGIKAPKEVRVLRGELVEATTSFDGPPQAHVESYEYENVGAQVA